MKYISVIVAGILAVVTPHLYGRLSILLNAYKNRPSQLVHRQLPYKWTVELEDQVKNCEHFVLDHASGLAILSCDFSRNTWNAAMGFFRNHDTTQGGIFLWDYANRHSDESLLVPVDILDYPLAGTDFHPLGIGYDSASETLFVANHAKAGNRLEVFHLDMRLRSAIHIRSIVNVQLPEPNSILVVSGTEIYVTNSHYFTPRHNSVLSKAEMMLGLPISGIVHVDLSPELDPIVTTVTRHAFANGIAKLNDTTFAVASTSTASVRIYTASSPTKWNETGRIDVDMFPDNLSIDSEGTLWIAGHPNADALEEVAFSRLDCDPASSETAERCSKMSAPSHVVSWTEQDGVKDVYVDDAYWAACTAARDGEAKMGLVSGLYGYGILTWRE